MVRRGRGEERRGGGGDALDHGAAGAGRGEVSIQGGGGDERECLDLCDTQEVARIQRHGRLHACRVMRHMGECTHAE